MSEKFPIRPSGDFPTEEDYLCGNLTPEWVRYFEEVKERFSDLQLRILENYQYDRDEAQDLNGVINDPRMSLSDKELYIRNFPPTITQIIQLQVLQYEKDIPEIEHGQIFTKRKKGAQAEHTKEIYSLAKQYPDKSAKELQALATHPKAKKLSLGRFATVVSEAKKIAD